MVEPRRGVDGSLSCGAPTPDADGVHDDYCCAYD